MFLVWVLICIYFPSEHIFTKYFYWTKCLAWIVLFILIMLWSGLSLQGRENSVESLQNPSSVVGPRTEQGTIQNLLLPIVARYSQELMFSLNIAHSFPFSCSLEAQGALTHTGTHTGVNSPLLVNLVDSRIKVTAVAVSSTTATVTAWACNVERMFALWVSPGLYLRLPTVPTCPSE